MRLKKVLLMITGLLLSSHLTFAAGSLETAAVNAVSNDKEISAAAIQTLRQNKQKGLDALFETYTVQINEIKSGGAAAGNWQNISNALDGVAMQKDAYSARLYWHTDLEEAKRESASTHKPILSLRLLGNLNEEYSCANSRFFRAILYTDPAISNTLREKYVLHWESVRPAPKMTIEFGDGRKMVTTITGNSIHYVLDSRGHIIDALPGLYAPAKFKDYLDNLQFVYKNAAANPSLTNDYRINTAGEIIEQWQEKLALFGKTTPKTAVLIESESRSRVDALEAAPIAVTKMVVEMSAVIELSRDLDRLKLLTEMDDWEPFAEMNGPVVLSPESVSFMRRQLGSLSSGEFEKLITNTKKFIAIDTVRNEYIFHTKLLTWLNGANSAQLHLFNERVYSQLFLTPRSDKWYGLYSPEVYSGIEDNGVR